MKIAVITGASSGMGKEFVRQIDQIEKLDEIWVLARRLDRLKALIGTTSAAIRPIAADLTSKEDLAELGCLLTEERPEVRYLVNASGYGKVGDYEEVGAEESCRMIDLNVKALVEVTYLILPYMKRGGHIIEIGSSSSFNPLPNFNVYASTKAFVRHFTRALHEELKPRGISATVVCPGWVETEFFDHLDDSKVKHPPKAYRPIAKPAKVVALALKDAGKRKPLSIYGGFSRVQHLAGKILPHSLMMWTWKKMLK